MVLSSFISILIFFSSLLSSNFEVSSSFSENFCGGFGDDDDNVDDAVKLISSFSDLESKQSR